MRNMQLAKRMCHTGNFHCSNHSSEVEHVSLNDLKSIVCNQPAEPMKTGLLLSSRNGYFKSLINLFSLFIPVKRNRLYIKVYFILFQYPSNPYCFINGV